MRIGVPTEIKADEYRVAMTPAGVREMSEHGHEVLIQAGAGEGSSIADADYEAQGARIVADFRGELGRLGSGGRHMAFETASKNCSIRSGGIFIRSPSGRRVFPATWTRLNNAGSKAHSRSQEDPGPCFVQWTQSSSVRNCLRSGE